MTLSELFQQIQSEIPALKEIRKIIRAANRTINYINTQFIGYQETEKPVICHHDQESVYVTINSSTKTIYDKNGGNFATKGYEIGDKIYISGSSNNDGTYTITNITTTDSTNDTLVVSESVTDETVTCYIIPYYVDSNYSWDYDNHILTLPSYCKELMEIYENDEELDHRDLETVYDSDNEDELYFTVLSRTEIKFPDGLIDSEDDYLKIKMLKNLTTITSTTESQSLDIPVQMEQLLINGTMFNLLSKPEFRDEMLFKEYKQSFFEMLSALNEWENTRMPLTDYEKKYNYFGEV